MNQTLELFDQLTTLCDEHEAFYYSDQMLQSRAYRIFNYRLGSYSQWLLPAALECRGITFLLPFEQFGDELTIASRPFEKFFNLHENPFTMDLDLETIADIQVKEDGSLISSMMVGNDLWLKSKGSLTSEQATDANNYLSAGHDDLYQFIYDQTRMGRSVIMEWTAPFNRIVLPYERPALTILAIRDNETGDYISLDSFEGDYDYEDSDALDHFVHRLDVEELSTPGMGSYASLTDFIERVPEFVNIEGFVCQLTSGQRFKIKTEWYMKLHHIKDSINSQRRLFEAVVYETSDDIKAQFWDDEQAIAIIVDMEEKVSALYNHMVNEVESFYKANKGLERKEYAIKAQAEVEKLHFGLCMSLYLQKPVDFKAVMVKNRKHYGIKDDPTTEAVENANENDTDS